MSSRYMKDKQKVTLYIPQQLHRQLKVRAALDCESMSDIAEKAIHFYLNHSEVVEGVEASYGHSHQVYSCPECESSLVMRDGDIQAVGQDPSVLTDMLPEASLELDSRIAESASKAELSELSKEGRLVPC